MKRALMVVLMVGLVQVGFSARAADALKVDDEGFIRNGLVLGPINLGETAGNHDENSQKGFFDKEQFEGQFTAAPKDGDKVQVGGNEMAFSVLNADGATFKFSDQGNSMNMIVTYVVAEDDMADVTLSIGSDDSSCWRLNEQEIIRVYQGRGVDRDQNKSQAVTLKKGVNVLMGAVINGGGPTGACARFLDKEGKPVTNVTIQLVGKAAKEAAEEIKPAVDEKAAKEAAEEIKPAVDEKAAEEAAEEIKPAVDEKAADEAAEEIKPAEDKKAAEEAKKKAEADKKAADEKARAEKKAAEEKAKADKKAAEEKKKAEEKAAVENAMAEKKAAEETARADKKAAEEKKKAEKKAAVENAMAEKKAAEEKARADKKAAEEKKKAEEKAAKEAGKAEKK